MWKKCTNLNHGFQQTMMSNTTKFDTQVNVSLSTKENTVIHIYIYKLGVLIEKWVLPLEMFDCKYDNENFKKNKTKNDNSSYERAHAIFHWASTIFCWASTCQFLITRLLIGQRASYNRFFHWLFPDANDRSNDQTKDHQSFPNMKLPTAAIIVSVNCLLHTFWEKLLSVKIFPYQ